MCQIILKLNLLYLLLTSILNSFKLNQFIVETLNYIFRSLFCEEYLYPLLHFMVSLENREFYMGYTDMYGGEVYSGIIKLEETGKYIYIITRFFYYYKNKAYKNANLQTS